MREKIVFTWSHEEQAKTSLDPWLDGPAWARVAGFRCVALSSTAPPETSQHWVSLAETPRVGQMLNLHVWRPFRGALRDLIWISYPPPAENREVDTNWCEEPPALPTGGVALCLVTAMLSHDEPEGHYLPGARLQVSIEDVAAVPDLAFRFAPRSAGRPLPGY